MLTSLGQGGQNQPIAARQWASGFLPTLFSDSPEVIHVAKTFLWIAPISYGAYGIVMVVNAAFNGLGNPLPGVVISVDIPVTVRVSSAFTDDPLPGLVVARMMDGNQSRFGNAATVSVILSDAPEPVGQATPVTHIARPGASVRFSIEAAGDPETRTLQWRRNTIPLSDDDRDILELVAMRVARMVVALTRVPRTSTKSPLLTMPGRSSISRSTFSMPTDSRTRLLNGTGLAGRCPQSRHP